MSIYKPTLYSLIISVFNTLKLFIEGEINMIHNITFGMLPKKGDSISFTNRYQPVKPTEDVKVPTDIKKCYNSTPVVDEGEKTVGTKLNEII